MDGEFNERKEKGRRGKEKDRRRRKERGEKVRKWKSEDGELRGKDMKGNME